MQIHSVGIDLGKTTFHLVALGAAGKVLVRKKFTQKQLLMYMANLQTSLIGLEACSGAHFLGRALRKQGHDVRLIAAQFVKPFVKSNKNDFVDAEAIAEAVERKNMRFVSIKTDDQLDLQAIHRVRDRMISRRTAVINQLRAFLLERGMVFAQKPAKLKAAMADILENAEADLTPLMRRHARNTSWPGELISTQRPNTFAQTCLLDQTSPCSPAADHTFSVQIRAFPRRWGLAGALILQVRSDVPWGDGRVLAVVGEPACLVSALVR